MLGYPRGQVMTGSHQRALCNLLDVLVAMPLLHDVVVNDLWRMWLVRICDLMLFVCQANSYNAGNIRLFFFI